MENCNTTFNLFTEDFFMYKEAQDTERADKDSSARMTKKTSSQMS